MSVYLTQDSSTGYHVYQKPRGARDGEYVAWKWYRYSANPAWGWEDAQFRRLAVIASLLYANNGSIVYNNGSGGDAWTAPDTNVRQYDPGAAYVAGSASATLTIPTGTWGVAVEIMGNTTYGITQFQIDGGTALVNGPSLNSGGEFDGYNSSGYRPHVVLVARDLPAGTHELKIIPKAYNSHAAGVDVTRFRTIYFLSRSAVPTDSNLLVMDARRFQGVTTSDLIAINDGDGFMGGPAHDSETATSHEILVDGVAETLGDGQCVAGNRININTVCNVNDGSPFAIFTKQLTFDAHVLETFMQVDFLRNLTNADLHYLAMFSQGYANYEDGQWDKSFWGNSYRSWDGPSGAFDSDATSAENDNREFLHYWKDGSRLALRQRIVSQSPAARAFHTSTKSYWNTKQTAISGATWTCRRKIEAFIGYPWANIAGDL